ncbi:VWA domain-containing protein [Paenibacillus sp. 481]|nr:VWA domain-containing protein [Paenibacillus sp. 481]UHA75957.1 VWA domain-containing protein [Paenibacillus sp. 481]
MFMAPLIGSLPVASAATQQSSKIDAMLVVDVSNSMNTSDANKIGNEAMKMFIDMLSTQGDRVGIVAYTDKIEREKALLEIQSAGDKQELKQFIDQLNRGAYTDNAVGVKEAVKLLKRGADPAHEPMIVLLADGNNYLNKKSSRTQEQSDEELSQAVADAKKQGIPVYTIGLNADGKLNKNVLADIANKTGAKSFITDSADDLPRILSEIFASHLKLKMVPIQSMKGNGSFQEVTINVPNANVLEANISIMSAKPVEVRLTDPAGKSRTIPSQDVMLAKSKSYSLLKLLQPEQGDWKLEVKGVSQDNIDINLVFNYDMELTMEPIPAKTYKQGDEIDIRAQLVSNGQKVQNSELYKNMNAVLHVKDVDTGDVEEIKLKHDGDHFAGTYQIAEKHDYELKVRAEEQSFYRETKPVKISAKSGNGTAGSSKSGSGSASESDEGFPVGTVVIGTGIAIVVAVAAYFAYAAYKKTTRGFVGQLVIEIRDENTGEKTHPQYRKLTGFKGKFNLHQVLQLAAELKETDKIVFVPSKNDRIMLRSGADSTIEKSGRAIDTSSGYELKSGDRITVPLRNVDKTILIEYLV